MIKAVIFDCFGVLVQSGWQILEDEYSPGEEAWAEIRGISHQADLGLYSQAQLEQAIADILNVEVNDIKKLFKSQQPNSRIFKIVAKLKQDDYKLAVLSNVAEGMLQELLNRDQLGLFDELALSSSSGIAKPDERAYLNVAKSLGTEPEDCLFIDDAPRNISAAHQVGMQAFLYKNFKDFEAELEVALSL